MNSGGIQDTYLGIEYQLVLLLLYAHKLSKFGSKFILSTEQRDIGYFDDIVVQVIEPGIIHYIFGQSKYKINPITIEFKTFIINKNFQLSKYFESWLKILNNPLYKKCTKEIYIITNNLLDTAQILPNGLVKIDSDDLLSSLLFAADTSINIVFDQIGKRYKFPDGTAFPTERQTVFQTLKDKFLAHFAVQSGFDDNLNSFMDRLVFVFALETKDIRVQIQKDLQDIFKVSDVSVQLLKLEECIKNAFTSRDINKQKISECDYQKVLQEYILFESKLVVMEKTSEIPDDTDLVEFQIIKKDIEDLLDPQINSANKILHVKTRQKSESKFVSTHIYKKLSKTVYKDTYIMMKTCSEEFFRRGVEVFEKYTSFKFLIIEVDSGNDLFEKYRSQVERALQSPSKKLMVITDVKSNIKFSQCLEVKLHSNNDHFYEYLPLVLLIIIVAFLLFCIHCCPCYLLKKMQAFQNYPNFQEVLILENLRWKFSAYVTGNSDVDVIFGLMDKLEFKHYFHDDLIHKIDLERIFDFYLLDF